MNTVCGRADLVRALATADPAVMKALAGLLGYAVAPPQSARAVLTIESFLDASAQVVVAEPAPDPAADPDVPFWRPVRRTYWDTGEEVGRLAAPEQDRMAAPGTAESWSRRPASAPPWPSLCSRNRLIPRLRAGMADHVRGRVVDLPAAVLRVAKAQLLEPLPYRRRRRWGSGLQVIDDRSPHLTPFWKDQDEVCGWLSRLFPAAAFSRARLLPGAAEPIRYTAHGVAPSYQPPPPGTLVLVLGDLGCLDHAGGRAVRRWRDIGHRLGAAGCVPVALMPCPPSRWHPSLRTVWRLVEWEPGAASQPCAADAVPEERLLRLVSPSIRVEPGLLRTIRRTLAPACGGAEVEAAVWQHPAIASPSSVAATLDTDALPVLRQGFAGESAEVQRDVLAILRQWRASLSADVWFEEILSLTPESRRHLPVAEDLDEALARFNSVSQRVPFLDDPMQRAKVAVAVRRLLRRVPPSLGSDPRAGAAIQRLWVFACQDALDDGDAVPSLPGGLDPRIIPPGPDAVLRRIDLWQRGDEITVDAPDPGRELPGSPLVSVWTVNGLVTIEEEEDRNAFWNTGTPPAWAEDWGWDDFGAWATFRIGGVVQKMRWIPPGTFLMGSPEDEVGRSPHEGPQHAVTLTRGFWLFDTACPQALWRAVMRKNPSRFHDDKRCPVEQVSWKDVQGFLKRINHRLSGLMLGLPTEAQWEYACRAGTTTPFSFGETITPDQVNYDGNFPDQGGEKGLYRERTVPVRSLPSNPWGLYEMHGNVWEWCADGWRDYTGEAVTDPRGSDDPGSERVLRGGSWIHDGRNVRSATRIQFHPVDRDDGFGFRCASIQASREGGAEPAAPAPLRHAERRGAQGTAGAAVLRGDSGGACPLPFVPAFSIGTDREEVRLERLTRPAWADACGRDRFGLWADIVVEPVQGGAPVMQRLRWIPPGRFLMGSPEDEPKRESNEGPQHEVTLTRGFWMFDTACTQTLWRAVMGGNPSQFQDNERCPVEQTSWNAIQMFLRRVNDRLSGLSLGLPTEAQWEYACRAGTATPFSLGETITSDQVNYNGNFPYRGGAKGLYQGRTVPVGSLPPNSWGLYEMHGNVWEWCADGRQNYRAEAVTDPRGPEDTDTGRVLRGGSWIDGARGVRAAARLQLRPKDRGLSFGFRCVEVQPSREVVEWYVSYAWGDLTPEGQAREAIVNDLCAAAQAKGRTVLRDRDVLGLGDDIPAFMRRIGGGSRVFVILSDKYLRSPYCMFELSEIWRTSREKKDFLDQVRVYALPDARIWTPKDRIALAVHWKQEFEALDSLVREHGASILGEHGHAQLRHMDNFYRQTGDILAAIATTLQPRNFEELERYGLRD